MSRPCSLKSLEQRSIGLVLSSRWQPNYSTSKCRWKTTLWVGILAGELGRCLWRGHVPLLDGRGPPCGYGPDWIGVYMPSRNVYRTGRGRLRRGVGKEADSFSSRFY